MVGATLGHYRILAELGAGGMGEVFKAEDTLLKRQVALKILPLQVSDSPERLARFRREAESLAALNHPGIVTIYSVETATLSEGPAADAEASGEPGREVHFLTMELVDGKVLSRLNSPDGLSLKRIFDIAIPLADAIGAAHKEGVVHRDLKPANIMITTEGRVKVLDFGLAKMRAAIEVADATRTLTETLTAEGAIVGTVPYMSPEQLEGRDVDSRSDLFSLGVILFEMATGRRPFRGGTPVSLVSAIVKDTPEEVDTLRADLPHHLARIIGHCIEKDPADRLQSALDVRNELRTLKEEVASGTVASSRASEAARGPRSRRSSWIAATALVLLAVIAWALWIRTRDSAPLLGFAERDWVLITDFRHPEGESDIAAALALALRVGLEESGYVNVVAQSRIDNVLTMMRQDKTTPLDLSLGREICQRGGVKALLAPELARVGNEYLITLSLIFPATGESVASFSERASNQDTLLDGIDLLIERLRRELGESLPKLGSAEDPLDSVTTSSLEALTLYSKGRRDWALGQHHAAVELFQEAIAIDPQFATAYAALGNSYASYLFNAPDLARVNYDKAVELLDRVGERERYFIEASYQSHFGSPEEAIQAFGLYLDRYPDDAAAHYHLGGIYRDLGNCEKAGYEYQQVLAVDPDNAGALINTATCISSREPQKALAFFQDAFRIRPEWEISGNLNHEYGMTLLMTGQVEDASRTFEKRLASTDTSERGAAQRSLGQLSIFTGRFDSAAEHFESAALLHQENPASAGRDLLFWAFGESARGDMARCVELLDRARKLTPLAPGWIWLRSLVGMGYLAAGDLEAANQISEELDSWASAQEDSGFDALRRREILGASVLAANGNAGQALEILNEIREIDQLDNAFLHWAIAEAAFRGEEWDQAASALEDLLELRWVFYETLVPWVRGHYNLGTVLDQLGEAAEAEIQYNRFLEIWGDADSPIPEVEKTRQRLSQESP
jgi:tetratricopeptide (TPR) repeat protein